MKGLLLRISLLTAMALLILAYAVFSASASNRKSGNGKLQSSLSELSAILENQDAGAAEAFAVTRSLRLKDGRVTVVVESAPGASAEEASTSIQAAGGQIETSYLNRIQALVPVPSLESLSGSPDVSFIREPRYPMPFVTSEGVGDIGAYSWISQGNDGAGTKVAVVDPGFSGYQQRVAEGELPANVITKSFTTGNDITGGGEIHGTACAEIVYDTAPGAQLYLVNFGTDVELGNAIEYLKTQGVQIVSASWGFFGEFRGDGQGTVDDMVKSANQAGIFWANAAGNMAQHHWSGYYSDANGNDWNEFSGADENNAVYGASGSQIEVYLTWNRWPATDQDYDLYLYWSGAPGAPVAASENYQQGSQSPSEELSYIVPPGQAGSYYVRISRYSAAGDAKFQMYTFPYSPSYKVTSESLGGEPSDSAYVMTAGAVQVGTTTLESFSSRGPTTDGRIKPDIVAPDGVSTVSYGNHAFYGTSAAAPHLAGAAAIIKGVNPSYSPALIQSTLESMTTDLGVAGKDNLYGSGKLKMGSAPADQTPPTVSDVQPRGTVYSTSSTVRASYSDSGAGINTSSVEMFLDGKRLTGCAVTSANVSCPVSGMGLGTHSISGSVADNAGNRTPVSGSFNVVIDAGGLLPTPRLPLPFL